MVGIFMAAMTFRPNAFDVGVNIFGVTNWVRTLKSIPPWWEAARESLYKELGNPFLLRKITCIRYLHFFMQKTLKNQF